MTTAPEAAERPAVWLSPQGDVLASQGETGVVVGDRHESLTFESNAPTVHMNQNGQTHTFTVGGRAHFTFDADQGGDVTGGPGVTVHNTNVVSGNARVGAQYNVRYGDGRATSRTTYSTSDDRQAEHIRREAERVQREIEHAVQAATAAEGRFRAVNTASGDDIVTQQTGVTFHRKGDRFSTTGSGRVFVNGKQVS
ncbi:hypothetical protein CNX65_10145 [Actinosynnema pretiosum]|uniref:Uncharacterized protein n=1 Tax=Actinosynnema pretiosum TaxID=42197 RepID=A0A290Z3N0_9PSEU|nr:hypothetical protein CNX65_10145 [Actinosynnema pretiosum]